jgi:hypothetical protein
MQSFFQQPGKKFVENRGLGKNFVETVATPGAKSNWKVFL